MGALLTLWFFFADVQTVPKVDLQKYSGVWYEIARIPNRFQRDCTGNVTATYKLNPDRTIQVVNRCAEKGKSEPKAAEGVARVAKEDKGGNSVLEVRFAPAFLSFISAVWGDYRILALDDNYQHAMVGSNDRKYLWVLSRTKTLSEAVYQKLLAEASRQGFDSKAMVRTPQK
jgi:apolipoprotein D and lipocalin family protein